MTRHYCRRCELKWYDVWGDGHVHDYTYRTEVIAPTCTEDGYTAHSCICGDAYRDGTTSRLGHSFRDGVCTRCHLSEELAPCDGGSRCPSRQFSDVNTNKWYHESIDYAIANGLMNGVGSGKFSPNGTMTRAMLVTVLWRYTGAPDTAGTPFTDVPSGEWYSDAVAWAAGNDIVNGVGGGRFDPDGQITREQMATMLFRYAEHFGIDTSARGNIWTFRDSSEVHGYAEDAISWCVASSIIGGTESGGVVYLNPRGMATRAEVATILMRYIKNVVNG